MTNTKTARNIAQIIKKEPLSVLIILSIFSLPFVFENWIKFFPEIYKIPIIILIIIIWGFAFFRLRKETLSWRRKMILYNYLKKWKWRSIEHITTEWYGKNDFNEKTIDELVRDYPDIFKWTDVRRNGKFQKGISLVDNELKK